MARHASLRTRPELIALVKSLRYRGDGRKRPMHAIAHMLADLGHLSHTGTPFCVSSIRQMLLVDAPQPHPDCPACAARRASA